MILLKTPEEIKIMDESNRIVHAVLDVIEQQISPGISTDELNNIAEEKLSTFTGAAPAFKGYHGFPKSLCISINEEIVHGIPGDRIIQDKDIVSIDFGVNYKGYAGDAARTFIIGDVSDEASDLVTNTKASLLSGIKQMREGNRLSDIGAAIDKMAKQNNYGNVRNYTGHGIGKNMHEAPRVFNYVNSFEPDIRLQEGLVLAIEPMFLLGKEEVEVLPDGWTVVTKDKKLAAHWEFSIAITNNGPKILGVSNDAEIQAD